MAGPADEVTLESPADAFEETFDADCLAFAAASVVEELCRSAVLRTRNCDCRSTARDAVMGISGGPVKVEKGVDDEDREI